MVFLQKCTKDITWEPILISKDVCHYCKMTFTDKRFGAELVTAKGKVYKFDSIECFGHFYEDNPSLTGKVFVVNSFQDKQMIDLKNAYFYHDPEIRSPMGKGLFASSDIIAFENNKMKKEKVIRWQDVFKLIGRSEMLQKL